MKTMLILKQKLTDRSGKVKKEISDNMLQTFKIKAQQMGFETEPSNYENGLYGIYHNDTLLSTIIDNGVLGNEMDTGFNDLQNQINTAYTQMKEAHGVYESATPLPFDSINDYRLISSYGDTLLAAKMTKNNEVHFTTWSYDYDHTGVVGGHYYATNYEGAKQDFAVRAGLIDKDKLFEKEELASIYDACVYRGVNDGDITYDDEKLLRDVMEKVEENLPEAIRQDHVIENELEQEQ